MAAPNLRYPTVVTGKTTLATLSVTLTSVLANGASSGMVLKLNTIRAANTSGGTVNVDIAVVRGAATYYLIKGGAIDSGKTLITTNKEEYIYLEEGDDLKAKASAGTSVDFTVNYEEIS